MKQVEERYISLLTDFGFKIHQGIFLQEVQCSKEARKADDRNG